MRTKKLLVLILSIILIVSLFAFKNKIYSSEESKGYEYITLIVKGFEAYTVYVSIGGESYKKIYCSKKETGIKGRYDLNPVIRLLNGYGKEGYEIVENNFTAIQQGEMVNYFLLRKVVN